MSRLVGFLLLLAALGPALRAEKLTVFAAVSLSNVLTEIASGYTAEGGGEVRFNFAGSNELVRQIKAGSSADLFFSADEARMDDLARAGMIAPETRVGLLSNSLVVVVESREPAPLTKPADLAGPALRRLALADPGAVPAGIYARKYLERAGVWEAVLPKVIPTENVRAALATVEAGNAQAAIVYKTDALLSKAVVVAWSVPESEGPAILYPVAALAGSKQPEAARAWLAYLRGPAARAIFERHGFVVRAEAAPPARD